MNNMPIKLYPSILLARHFAPLDRRRPENLDTENKRGAGCTGLSNSGKLAKSTICGTYSTL